MNLKMIDEIIDKYIFLYKNDLINKKLCKFKGNNIKNGYIYFYTTSTINIFQVLFDQKPKDFLGKIITILDENNGYANLKVHDYEDPVLIIISPNSNLKEFQ